MALLRWMKPRANRLRWTECLRLIPGVLSAGAFLFVVALMVHLPGLLFLLLTDRFDDTGTPAAVVAAMAAIVCATVFNLLLFGMVVRLALPRQTRHRTAPARIHGRWGGSLVASGFATVAFFLLVGLPAHYGFHPFAYSSLAGEHDVPRGVLLLATIVGFVLVFQMMFLASAFAMVKMVGRWTDGTAEATTSRPVAASRAVEHRAVEGSAVRRANVPDSARLTSLSPGAAAHPPIVPTAVIDRGEAVGLSEHERHDSVVPFVIASLVLSVPLGWLGFGLPYALFVMRCCRIATGRRVRRPLGHAIATVARWCWSKIRSDHAWELQRRLPDTFRFFRILLFVFIMQLFTGLIYLAPLLIADQVVVEFGTILAIVVGFLVAFIAAPKLVCDCAGSIVRLSLKKGIYDSPSASDRRRAGRGDSEDGSFRLAFLIGLSSVPLLGAPILFGAGPMDFVWSWVNTDSFLVVVFWGGSATVVSILLFAGIFLLSRRFFIGVTHDYLSRLDKERVLVA